jgi:hypothetical protein
MSNGKGESKGKAHPRTGHDGPDGKPIYSSTLSLTSALDGVSGQRHALAALPPERPGTHCTGGWVGPRAGLDGYRKFRSPSGFDLLTVRPVGSRYAYYAIPVYM